MMRIMSGLGLWFFGAVFAFADTTSDGNFTHIAVADTDLSMKYLGQLFGHVSGVLPRAGSDLLGHIFYVFNQGVLVLAAVWLAYTIFNMIINAGLDGAINTPQRRLTLVMFRVAVGLALLIPSSNTGYSAVQTLMMRVVVEGVKLADQMWSYSLDYLADGGVIYAKPSNTQLSITQLKPFVDVQNDLPVGVIQKIYSQEACMFLSNRYNQWQSGDQTVVHPFRMISVAPFTQSDGTIFPGAVYFPGYGDYPPYRPTHDKAAASAYAHTCGYFLPTTKGWSRQMKLMQYQESFAAINQMAIDLLPLARRQAYAIRMADQPGGQPVGAQAGGQMVSNAVLDYLQVIRPYANFVHSQHEQAYRDFVPHAKQQGWITAGNFYWSLARLNDAMNSATDVTGYLPQMGVDTQSMPKVLSQAIDVANNLLGDNHRGTIWGVAQQNLRDYIQSLNGVGEMEAATPINQSYTTGGVDFANIIQNAFNQVVSQFYRVTSNTNNSGFYDPLDFVQQLGRSCLTAAGSIWAHVTVAIIALAAISGICTSISPGGNITQALVNWMTPLWTMSATGMFVAGFMLTFYAPLYPYLLFLFGAIGWLLYVVEAMVAAPLVAFGMTHPENHDFLGRAEQAAMLALGVFLKPVLMVIGFLVAILLSYIGFSVVNYGFGQVLITAFGGLASGGRFGDGAHHISPLNAIWSVVNGSSDHAQGSYFTGHDLSDFLLIPLLMITYGLIAIEVVNQCFSTIHQLPTLLMRWIGGPVNQDNSERYAQTIKSGVQSSAQEGARAAGQGSIGFGNAVGQYTYQNAQSGRKNLQDLAKGAQSELEE